MTDLKTAFSGAVIAVQPRIRMLRSFDERSHTYQGYTLRLNVGAPGTNCLLVVAIGEAAQKKHSFRLGDIVSGEGIPPQDARTEVAQLYKVPKLKVLQRLDSGAPPGPPWHGVPPELATY